MSKPKTIAEYIDSFSGDTKKRLEEMLECLREVAPGAEENIKWGNPALSYDWILFQFAAFKDHISLFPTPSVVEAFKDELKELKTSSSTIQFPLDKPLLKTLIKKIALLRVKEAKAGKKWM